MADDLLSKIRVQTHERMRALRPAVDEHERLLADLRALDQEVGVAEETVVRAADMEVGVPCRARPLVSPKVLRLMGPPGRV